MNNLAIDIATNAKGLSLEELLFILARHGKPRVSQFDDGTWNCTVNMRVASQGVTFEIKSDFNQKTPSEAAMQCLNRMIETLNKYGVNV